MIYAVLIFMFFIVLIAGGFLLSEQKQQPHDFSIEYLFLNLENNLRIDRLSNPAHDYDFLANSRVSKMELVRFAAESALGTVNVDDFVVGNISGTHGIGLDPDAYDACIFFVDNDGAMLRFNGHNVAIGKLKDGSSCDNKIQSGVNPCLTYSTAVTIFIPVLLDEGSQASNRIIQMNIVLCRL
jgi:hypothetical protein